MSAKRNSDAITTCESLPVAKKAKVEEKPFRFPFHVIPVMLELSKYLEGDHLKNFKLACKAFNVVTKTKSCTIQITPENLERTTSTPGYHHMEVKGNAERLRDELYSLGQRSYPEVKHLTIDYCGLEDSTDLFCQAFINRFENLHTLRIIRCRKNLYLKIYGLSSLELYTTGWIKLKIENPIEKALLCSTEKHVQDRANIIIHIPYFESSNYVSGFKCNASGTSLDDGVIANRLVDHPFKSFVPNPKLL